MWKLIIDGARDGATNMSIDAALLAEIEASLEPRTVVRFYRWQTPTISLGRNQKIEKAVDAGYCRANGIDIVHRPTGGRAVLHDDELTYAVISNDAEAFGDTIYGNYRRVSEALCLGYNRLGVEAVLAPDTRKATGTSDDDVDLPCFLSTSRYELMVRGHKIVAARRGGCAAASSNTARCRSLATAVRWPERLEWRIRRHSRAKWRELRSF